MIYIRIYIVLYTVVVFKIKNSFTDILNIVNTYRSISYC